MKLYKHDYVKILRKHFRDGSTFTTEDVMNALQKEGFDVTGYMKFQASVNQMLRQLIAENDPVLGRVYRGTYRLKRTRKSIQSQESLPPVEENLPPVEENLPPVEENLPSLEEKHKVIETVTFEKVSNPMVNDNAQYEFDFDADPLLGAREDLERLKARFPDVLLAETETTEENIASLQEKAITLMNDLHHLLTEIGEEVRSSEERFGHDMSNFDHTVSIKDVNGVKTKIAVQEYMDGLEGLFERLFVHIKVEGLSRWERRNRRGLNMIESCLDDYDRGVIGLDLTRAYIEKYVVYITGLKN